MKKNTYVDFRKIRHIINFNKNKEVNMEVYKLLDLKKVLIQFVATFIVTSILAYSIAFGIIAMTDKLNTERANTFISIKDCSLLDLDKENSVERCEYVNKKILEDKDLYPYRDYLEKNAHFNKSYIYFSDFFDHYAKISMLQYEYLFKLVDVKLNATINFNKEHGLLKKMSINNTDKRKELLSKINTESQELILNIRMMLEDLISSKKILINTVIVLLGYKLLMLLLFFANSGVVRARIIDNDNVSSAILFSIIAGLLF